MKKAQVTIFLIIVIVAVIVSSILISNNNKKQLAIIQESEDVNLKQITPVKMYVENIMQDLLVEGLFLIGKQGGKIYVSTWPDCKEENKNYTASYRLCNQSGVYDYGYPEYMEKSPYYMKRVGIGINHSRIDGGHRITYSSDEPLEQPFAYPHIGKSIRVNYLYGSEQPLPSISSEAGPGSIESQLARWIEYHLPELLNLTELENKGFVIERQKTRPKVNVEMNEDYITVKMNYTLFIDKAESKYVLKEYYSEIKSDFRIIYDGIQDVIRQDISTKSAIWRQKIFNKTGQQVARIIYPTVESIPTNYKFDIVNITAWGINYTKRYGYDSPFGYYWFYFVRENRPSDTGTVKIVPQIFYVGQTATWFCINMKSAPGSSPFDPDEDDEWSHDPYPWRNPPWYVWYSRGDHLVTHENEKKVQCQGGGMIEYEHVIDDKQLHIDPYSKSWGALFMDKLPNCGNADDDVSTTASLEDVGDLIILISQDQESFPAGGEVKAPERYPDPPILEDGRGRLNDAISYRPVKCTPGDGMEGCCGDDGYWRFDDRTKNEDKVEKCLSVCKIEKYDAVDDKCNCAGTVCNHRVNMYWHCDHKGDWVYSTDYEELEEFDCAPLSDAECR